MLLSLAYICGFLLGISLESVFETPFEGVFLVWILLIFMVFRKKFLLVIFFCGVGLFRVQLYEQSLETNLKSQFQTVSGVISDELDRRSAYQNVTLQTQEGEVLAKVSLYKDLEFGDALELQGEVELRSAMSDEDASYRNYLGRQGVVATIPDASVRSRVEGSPSFRKGLYAFKSTMERRLQVLLPEPESSFAAGLLLGSRKGMSPALTEAFQTVGLLHIVAISGSNISLVIATVFALLSFIPLRSRVFVSAGVLGVFVLLVGASSTVIRAAVMGVLTLLGLYSGRRSMALFGLLWSVVLLVLWNPYLLLFDVGFQLSVLSTLGLLVFVPVLESKLTFFEKMPPWAAPLKEAFMLTTAAQITTLPLMLHFFGQASWITLFVNVFVAPLIPLAMLASFFALFFSWFMAPAWVFLYAIEKIALLGAEVPGASFALTLSLRGMALAYFFELIFLLLFYKSILKRAFFRHRVPTFCRESILQFEKREKPKESLA